MLFVGLDLGDRFSHLTLLDVEGEFVEGTRLPTTQRSPRRELMGLSL